MQYTKIQCAFLRSIAFKDAEMAARGTWLTLNGLCADRENGGRIQGCRAWNDRQWLSHADCLALDIEVAVKNELAMWSGDDLLVIGYDVNGEDAFKAMSQTNRVRANGQWEKVRSMKGENAGGMNGLSRRHVDEMPPALPPAPKRDAAGTEKGCHTNQPSIHPSKGPSAPLPPPMGGGGASRESIEAARVRQREEALALHSQIEQSGRIDSCDPALLDALRKGIAYNAPGHPPIGGPFSATAKLREWLANPPAAKATA